MNLHAVPRPSSCPIARIRRTVSSPRSPPPRTLSRTAPPLTPLSPPPLLFIASQPNAEACARPALPRVPERSWLYHEPLAPPPPIAPSPMPASVDAPMPFSFIVPRPAPPCPTHTSEEPTRTHSDWPASSIGTVCSPSSRGSSGSSGADDGACESATADGASGVPTGLTTSLRDARRTAGWSYTHRSAAKYCGVPLGISYVTNILSCATVRIHRQSRHAAPTSVDATANAMLPPMRSLFMVATSWCFTCVHSDAKADRSAA